MHRSKFVANAIVQVDRLARYAFTKAEKQAIESMRRELASDLFMKRPRLPLVFAVEMVERLTRLSELNAPKMAIDHCRAEVQSLPRRLAAFEPDGGDRFFEPETRGSHRKGRVLLRHLHFWEKEEANSTDREPTLLDVSGPFLDRLGRDGALWVQQQRVLEASAGAWASVGSLFVGPWAEESLDGPLTPDVLRRYRESHPDSWRGARETPFLLGRIAHMIGPPAADRCPSVALHLEMEGFEFTARADDACGEGIPQLYLDSTSGPIQEEHIHALEELLFEDILIADVVAEGYDVRCGVLFTLGVREGVLFAQGCEGGSLAWHIPS